MATTHEKERQEIIASLCRIDPNGDWRDDDSDAGPLSLQEARDALADLVARD
jgi:hypothetical protein